MGLKLSNEHIIFMYLNLKREIAEIDKSIDKVELFVEMKRKDIHSNLKGRKMKEIPVHIQILIAIILKLTHKDKDLSSIETTDELLGYLNESLDNYRDKAVKLLDKQLNIRMDMISDIEAVYEILKEEMPDVVTEYTDLVNNSPDNFDI